MTLTLEIPPQVERELVREAEAQGVAVPELAVRLLVDAVARPASAAQTQRSPSRSEPGSIRSPSFRARFQPCKAKPSPAP
jgi:hypothetical protein